ncbi:helix-turn-helix domain-containing protein [Streptomyces sp. NPDC001858]
MTDQQGTHEGPVGDAPHDSNQQMTVSVDFEATSSYGAAAREVAHVAIQDANHPGIRAAFQYLVPDELPRIEQIGFSVTLLEAERPEGVARFGPGVIKDLPLARWDRVAQAAVEQAFMERSLAAVSVPLEPGEYQRLIDGNPLHGAGDPEEEAVSLFHMSRNRRERAIEMVRRVRPDLDPGEGKGSARSWNGLVKLAEALDEYMEILAGGSKDPAGEMAERHDVAQATVRTWVHRARQAGLTSTYAGWKPSGGSPTRRYREKPLHEAWRQLGLNLQNVREEKNISMQDASKALRVGPGIVHEIEKGQFGNVGGDVLARTLIRTYSRFLGLDPAHFLSLYDEGRKAEK